ncbi:MAG: helix-turn-helix domain-containing protein [Hyphomicrobiaceae bacterium]
MYLSTNIPVARAVFARRLRELRVPRGYRTARSLARALGIDENRYTRYERAEVEPDLALLIRICEALSVTPNDLLGDAMSHRSNGYVSGFAEAPAGETRAAPSADPERYRLKRQAAAWQLAHAVAQIETGTAAEPAGNLSELHALQRVSQIHAAIERDPFAFIAGVMADPRVNGLSIEVQGQLVGLIRDMTHAVEAHANG